MVMTPQRNMMEQSQVEGRSRRSMMLFGISKIMYLDSRNMLVSILDRGEVYDVRTE